jgi:serine/threonine protein kinase
MSKLQNHPNILNSFYSNPDGVLKNGSKTEDVLYNLIELAENGPVSNIVRVTGSIEEQLARFMFLQLSDAVYYMHSKRLAHLDIKLENILLDKYFNIKLADLGVTLQLDIKSNESNYRRGTVHYMAPEISNLQKNEKYDALKADIYSLGVCLYLMLIGEFPDAKFLNKSSSLTTTDSGPEEGMEVDVMKDQLSTNKWPELSENARNLIVQMLALEPESRPTIDEILVHPWFVEPFREETQYNLYTEMVYRKNFISTFYRKKGKSY